MNRNILGCEYQGLTRYQEYFYIHNKSQAVDMRGFSSTEQTKSFFNHDSTFKNSSSPKVEFSTTQLLSLQV